MHCCHTSEPDSIGGIKYGLPVCYKANGGDSNYAVVGGALQKGGMRHSPPCPLHQLPECAEGLQLVCMTVLASHPAFLP